MTHHHEIILLDGQPIDSIRYVAHLDLMIRHFTHSSLFD